MQASPYSVTQVDLLIPSPSFLKSMFWFWPGTFGYHLIYLAQLMRSNFQTYLKGPRFISKWGIRRDFPHLKELHNGHGCIMSEAQMSDSRMLFNTLLTAAIDNYIPGMKGTTLANYTEVKDFIRGPNNELKGAVCEDVLNPGEKFDVRAKVVVNCAGVFADELRLMAWPMLRKRIVPSRGTHLIFEKGLLDENKGVIVPETSDGRLLFIINYHGYPMVGTTDVYCEAYHSNVPDPKEIDFLIEEIKPYLGYDYDYRGNLLSAWAGLRPLVEANETD